MNFNDFFKKLVEEDDNGKSVKKGNPSFSIHDFKKWLDDQDSPELKMFEGKELEEVNKENLKDKFKKRINNKIKKKRKK